MKLSHAFVPRFHLVAMLAMAALSQMIFAATPASTSDAQSDAAVVALLTEKANAWDKAIVGKDRDAVAANMSDDFRLIGGAANVQDKQAFIDDVMKPGLKLNPIKVDEFEVRTYGDVALLSGLTTMSGTDDGNAFESRFRYIDVYVRGSDGWKIVSVQITRIPK